MAYTPTVQDLADIVKRFKAAGQQRLATYLEQVNAGVAPTEPPTAQPLELPPVQVQGPPPLPSSDPLSRSGLPFTNALPSNSGGIPTPGGGTFVPIPGGVSKFDPRTGVDTPITPGGHMAPGPETTPPILPTPGASTTFGFPTQTGSPLQRGGAYVAAPSGYGSGVPAAAPRLGDTVAPPPAGYDPGMGRTADLSLPPGFLQDYQRTKGALALTALRSGLFNPFGGPTSLADAFNQAIPQPQAASPDDTSLPVGVGAPLATSRRLS